MGQESLGGGLEEGMKYVTLRNAQGQVVTVIDGVTHLDGVAQPEQEDGEEEDGWEVVGEATGEEWYGEETQGA